MTRGLSLAHGLGPRKDGIRCAKDTGLGNVPLHDAASNTIWLAVVLPACDLLT